MRNGTEESNLKYFKVWGCLAKIHVPIPKRIEIGPNTMDCNFGLEQSSERSKRPWKEQKENICNREIQRRSKCQGTYTSFEYDFGTFLVSYVNSSFWKNGINREIDVTFRNPNGSLLFFLKEIKFWVQSESSKGK